MLKWNIKGEEKSLSEFSTYVVDENSTLFHGYEIKYGAIKNNFKNALCITKGTLDKGPRGEVQQNGAILLVESHKLNMRHF